MVVFVCLFVCLRGSSSCGRGATGSAAECHRCFVAMLLPSHEIYACDRSLLVAPLMPIYSDTAQLGVKLSWVGEVSIATQLNSSDWPASRWLAVWCNWVNCIADRRRQLSCVGEGVYSDATQRNSTLSWVELCRYKRALTCSQKLTGSTLCLPHGIKQKIKDKWTN